jgi:hypothetical protein
VIGAGFFGFLNRAYKMMWMFTSPIEGTKIDG